MPTVVYDIVAIPAVTPPATPVEPTVAIDGLLLLHVPPAGVAVSVIVLPAHTLPGPLICAPAKNAGNKNSTVRSMNIVDLFIIDN